MQENKSLEEAMEEFNFCIGLEGRTVLHVMEFGGGTKMAYVLRDCKPFAPELITVLLHRGCRGYEVSEERMSIDVIRRFKEFGVYI